MNQSEQTESQGGLQEQRTPTNQRDIGPIATAPPPSGLEDFGPTPRQAFYHPTSAPTQQLPPTAPHGPMQSATGRFIQGVADRGIQEVVRQVATRIDRLAGGLVNMRNDIQTAASCLSQISKTCNMCGDKGVIPNGIDDEETTCCCLAAKLKIGMAMPAGSDKRKYIHQIVEMTLKKVQRMVEDHNRSKKTFQKLKQRIRHQGETSTTENYIEQEAVPEPDVSDRQVPMTYVAALESLKANPMILLDEEPVPIVEYDEYSVRDQDKLFGCVTRIIEKTEKERKFPEVQKAIGEEMSTLESFGSFNLNKAVEWDDIKEKVPNAAVVGSRMLTGEKHAELKLPRHLRKYKGRLILQGNFIRGTRGQRIIEKTRHDPPISLPEARGVMGYSLFFPKPSCKQGDVRLAYPKAPLQGRPIYFRLDKSIQPEYMKHMKDPVLELHTTLYGLERADHDWGELRHNLLIQNKWEEIVHRKLYKKNGVLLGVYVDDCLFAKDEEGTEWAAVELNQILGFGGPAKELELFLGVQGKMTKAYKQHGTELVRISLEQENMIDDIVGEYKKLTGFSRLRKVATPMLTKEESEDEVNDNQPGLQAENAAHFVGAFLFLQRWCRVDVCDAVAVLSRSVKNWTKKNDRQLHRLMSYLEHHKKLSLVMQGDIGFLKKLGWKNLKLILKVFVDSDFAGDVPSPKSTTGVFAVLCVKDSYYWIPLDWWTKLQTVVAGSTTEAEFVAMCDCVKRSALPLQELLEKIFGKEIELQLHVDNSAAKMIGERGCSKNLKYLNKHQRVSESFVKEFVDARHEDRKIIKVESAKNLADLMTKGLMRVAHWRLCESIGMIPIDGVEGFGDIGMWLDDEWNIVERPHYYEDEWVDLDPFA